MRHKDKFAMKHDVFISYSRKDSAIVKKFADGLSKAGYLVWIDEKIELGDEFKEKIVSAIQASKAILFFSSVASNASTYVIKEIDVAVECKKPIIPVKLDDSEYSKSILFDLAGVNFVQHNNDNELSSTISQLIHSLHSKIGSGNVMVSKGEEDAAGKCSEVRKGTTEKVMSIPVRSVCKSVPCKVDEARGEINGHEYVDLGLPSGLKWATCNVGASYFGDNGDYYAWGELVTKGDYDTESCRANGKEMGDITGNPNYDVARKKWGATWRLPKETEFKELIDNCKWKWVSQGNCNGYKLTSKTNGNSIFLPAAGWRHDTQLSGRGECGNYWSSTPYDNLADRAYHLAFYKGYRIIDRNYRINGRSVRPVCD